MKSTELSGTRIAIWNAMLDADMNARYWAEMVRHYASKDKRMRIFLAVTSSATVASWAIAIDMRIIWQVLSSLAALVAVALPILDWPKQREKMAELSGEWLQLQFDYERLWRQSKDNDSEVIENELSAHRAREVKLQENTAQLPLDHKLIDRCYEAVVESRGLTG